MEQKTMTIWRQFVKYSDQELGHDIWMLTNQLNSPADLIALWSVFPHEVRNCPLIEKVTPIWFKGLERYIAANR